MPDPNRPDISRKDLKEDVVRDTVVAQTVTVNAENWQRIKAIVEACLDLPLAERASYLSAHCKDSATRAEVVSLLSAYEESEKFLDDPSPIASHMVEVLELEDLRIGSYRLIEEIGRGGMGTVYRAVRADDVFNLEVAIKVVRRGMDTEAVLERFRTERQILASLEHPYIARIMDGGTTDDDLPYFVMEYVEGRPLTRYCDEEKLSVPERLQLFRKVCEAVSYAHQNLVVHRDLKPGNILVTGEGKPKLLDFGIAKIVSGTPGHEITDATRTALRMATPAYASPEQIRGGLTTVASDVYSLGVVLYELLTGHPPYRLETRDPEALAQMICEREPTRASTVVGYREEVGTNKQFVIEPGEVSRNRKTTIEALKRRLRGDLDNIVATALRKEPQRRYGSVERLSEDVRRHLEGEPVLARKDTFRYRSSKFIERHRVGLAASLVIAIALCLTTAFAVWKAQKLAQRLEKDQKLASLYVVDVHDAIAKVSGSTPARQVLLEQSLRYLNELAAEAGDDPSAQRALALAHEKFTELQVGAVGSGLGQATASFQTYQKAEAIRERLASQFPGDRGIRYELAMNYMLGSTVAGRLGGIAQRLGHDRKAIAILEKLAQEEPTTSKYQMALATAHSSLAYGLSFIDRWTEAREHFQEALTHGNHVVNNAGDPGARREVALIHYRFGVSHMQSGELAGSLKHLEEALTVQSSLVEQSPDNHQLRNDMAATQHFLGVVLGRLGRYDEALSQLDSVIALREMVLAEDARDARTKTLLAGNYSERANVLLMAGKAARAIAPAERALKLQLTVLALDQGAVPVRIFAADMHRRAGAAHLAVAEESKASEGATHRTRAAELYATARDIYDRLQQEGHLRAASSVKDAEDARMWAKRLGR